jgi:hypothetical protein
MYQYKADAEITMVDTLRNKPNLSDSAVNSFDLFDATYPAAAPTPNAIVAALRLSFHS